MSSQPYELLKPFFKEKLSQVKWYSHQEKHAIRREGVLEDAKNIRLDWEMPYRDDVAELTASGYLDLKTKTLIINQISDDLADLVVNGDTNSNDPFLKVFDGEQKRGIRFADVAISDILHYAEFKPTKDTIEYTLYLLVKPIEGDLNE